MLDRFDPSVAPIGDFFEKFERELKKQKSHLK